MRCLSHVLIFKHEKCFKNHYNEMNKTRICWFCVKKLRTLGYIKNLDDLLKDDYYKNFINTGSLSPWYFPLSMGISE